MNTENEKRLDDLFKKKLGDPVDEIRYEEGDWDALEQMLDKPKRKGIIFLWPFISSVAAVALIFFGWWMFKNQAETKPNKNQAQAIAARKKADTIVEHNQIAAQNQKKDTIADRTAGQLQATAQHKAIDTIADHNTLIQTGVPVQKAVHPYNGSRSLLAASERKTRKDTIADNETGSHKRVNEALVAFNSPVFVKSDAIGQQQVKQVYLSLPLVGSIHGIAAKQNPKAARRLAYRTQYALSVVAAPDFNGVGSFQQSKVGTNIGLGFAVGLTRKFTVSTGVLYSVKPYMTNFSNYRTGYQWAVDPINVTADCRMLDIPINVGYQVYHKQQNKITLGTGLSSYIMVHESYKFNYEYGESGGPASYTVPNSGKYFFGVVNLNATYERQINSKVGLSIQPYLKLPLTNIGYSQVKLQTTGVAVGLTWNLNSLTKP